MTRYSWISVVLVSLVASGCPKDDKSGGTTGEDGGSSNPGAGSGGHSSGGGHARDGGGPVTLKDGGHSANGGTSGGGGGALDAGSSGGGALDAGKAGACKIGGCSAELCSDQDVASSCIYRPEFACYKTATCERQADGRCDWTSTPELQKCLGGSSSGGGLHWYQTCGTPVCMASDKPYDDPNIPNCTQDQAEGAACDMQGQQCDGVAGCGATLICSDTDPKMGPGGCPISRARYKQDIEYLDAQQLRAYHAQLIDMPLASYRYKSAPSAPQLGFIIDDVEPSVAVAGDQVNMYGYLSMAVAAIKVQAQQIEALERELEQLRAQRAEQPAMCTQ